MRNTIEQIDKKIEALNKQKQEILDKQEESKNKVEWINLEKGLEIYIKQMYNGKTYEECRTECIKNNYEIADYTLLQSLRNAGYEFLKDFWVFVPNPDKIMRDNDYVAWFFAYSDRAYLDCFVNPPYTDSALGVFIVRRKKSKGDNK